VSPEDCSVGKSLHMRTRAFMSQFVCEHFVYVPISIRAFTYLCPNYSIRKSLYMRLRAFMSLLVYEHKYVSHTNRDINARMRIYKGLYLFFWVVFAGVRACFMY
jgi:hypothetical protein